MKFYMAIGHTYMYKFCITFLKSIIKNMTTVHIFYIMFRSSINFIFKVVVLINIVNVLMMSVCL